MSKAFSEGVGEGGLHNTEDIKILVMYILKTANVPLSLKSITNVTEGSRLANYFEVTNAVSTLTTDGLISLGDDMYSLTNKGEDTIEQLKTMLSYYVLEEAKRAVSKEVIMARRIKENDVNIVSENGGYMVHISIKEQDKEIMGFNIHVGTLSDAELVKNRFYENPMALYQSNVNMLLGYKFNCDEGDQ